MNCKPIVLRLVALLLVVASVQTAHATDTTAVAALGRIEPEHGILRIAAPSTPESISGAVLKRLFISEGDDVKSGQLLAETDATDVLAALVVEAAKELDLARSEAKAADSVADAECVHADTARSEAERRTRLLEKGLAAEEEVEQAQGEAKSRTASCISSRAMVTAANTRVDVAEARRMRREAEYNRSRIYAPVDARVLKIVKRPGELIHLDGILELGMVAKMYAVAEVYETDIRRVRPGQKASINSDALEHPITGTVDFIHPKVQKHDEIGTDPAASKDARIIEVDILLDEPEVVANLTYLQVEIVIND